jgi:hypothetical protein|tara:strand:+ start:479 stop:1306 length:828 start_codon:yes stop_codon:yes gene_type:complete
MFKISFYVRRKKEVLANDFREYWLGEHAQIQKQYLEALGVRSYIKCAALPNDPVGIASVDAYQTGTDHYDFVDHWVFNDIETLKATNKKTDLKAAMQCSFESEAKYVDFSRSNVAMSVDLVQFFPVDDYRATIDNSFVKIYYCVRKLSELTRAEAQLHWNTCHGALSRQDIKYSVQSKYIQAHNIDSTFVDELAQKRGYDVDPDFIGHAEGWIDTNTRVLEFSADEYAEVVAMSMDDIDLFTDKKRSQLFVSKEYYIIDKPVIVRPMPKFFSAVY